MLIIPRRRLCTWPGVRGQSPGTLAVAVATSARLWASSHPPLCPLHRISCIPKEMGKEEPLCTNPGIMRKINGIFRQYLESSTYSDPSLPVPVTGFVPLCCFVDAPTASETPHHPLRVIATQEPPTPGCPQGCPQVCPRWVRGAGASPRHLHLPSLYLPPGLCIAAITDTLKHNDLAVSVMDDRTFLSGLNHC